MYGVASLVGVLCGTIWDLAANQGITVKAVGRVAYHFARSFGFLG
jgi:hypothetical protein